MKAAPRAAAPDVPELLVDGARAVTSSELLSLSDGLRKPVLFRQLCTAESEDDRWTLGHLFGLDPDGEVVAEYYVDADRRKPYEHVTTTFSGLADSMATEPEKWFLAESDFDRVFASVASELPRLSILPADARDVLRLVFFGNNTQSATHFHVRDQAILAHLRGEKRVILTPPDTTDRMATNSPFGGRPQFSTHGPDAGADALECFSDLLDGAAVQVDLEPGDALFIPVHWWHWVEGRGECISVTTFWRAALREWAFPHPGVRAATAVALGESAKVVRGVTRRLTNR